MVDVFDFQTFPILETERLIMRDLIQADADVLFEHYRDPDFTRYIFVDTHTSVDDTKALIAFFHESYETKDHIRWGVVLKDTLELIGNAGLHYWKRDTRCADVGYHIGQRHAGKGFATEVLGAMVEFGFERMNLNRIQGYHNPGNDVSGRVMEKLGFAKEGIWRQVELNNGKLLDQVWYSLLRDEYEQS